MIWLSMIAFFAALLTVVMFRRNLPLFRLTPSPHERGSEDAALASFRYEDRSPIEVSVLIPARNEEASIAACVESILANRDVAVEVIVLDDDSEDATASIVNVIASRDDRVRRVSGPPLPHDWNGKQYACWQLAQQARYPRLLFLDADVRLAPHAIRTLIERQETTDVALLSAFPQQETETFLEKMLIPMMHYILLCFLPFDRMRESTNPAYAAGCGQLFLTSQTAYIASGTHQAIKSSRHDGVKLPRVYRRASLMTDVIDGTSLARCRMYQNGPQVIRGLLKNASEGVANPRVIVIFTLLIFAASVLPLVALVVALLNRSPIAVGIALPAVVLSHLPRALAARHFRQPVSGVVLQSFAAILFLGLQWGSLALTIFGKPIRWRGRI
ncbi:4,4'-diaponeurosporenoate glycosyltransferase [Novipirellula galeiformis]|uniref:4,4'-diaponeurosporenoate glycosyltransferase n=1 Tax=Novipirellula galeiformis TaxID=2528004 RepID=A0A5C6C341_9BACT|nr:glycosyltransferase family A protein [Novipirellula galeiformis]TWU17684.1 4,4'-diaponeurosporenoate glycosyltransferase [Novipirellula galeiformis]